jgi:hypothetical protein
VCLLALGLSAACSGDGSAPKSLADGSDAIAPSVALEGVSEPAVLTKARVLRAADVGAASLAAACLGEPRRSARPGGGLVVERVGVASETVTFREESGLRGCDDSPGPREADRRWCGSPFGRLYRDRLRDPRLGIGCRTAGGEPMGFAWIEPDARTRFVSVRQSGFVEVYRTAGGLPVRVSSASGVSVERSSATFDVSEHDERGGLLRAYRLDATVAG